MKPNVGRITACTAELTEKIAEDLKKGEFVAMVCKKYHISHVTFYSWKTRGATGEEPFLSFLTAVENAEAYYISVATAKWREASEDILEETEGSLRLVKKGDWKALESYLKRLHPAVFGDNQQNAYIEQNNAVGMTDIDQLKDLSKKVMQKIITSEMSIDAGTQLIKCIDDRIKLLAGADYEQRMAEIEKKIGLEK